MSDDPIEFAGSKLDQYRHVCALFHTPDELYQVLTPFIREGFNRGDRAFHIVDPLNRQAHLQRLRDAGIDTIAAEKSGQLELRGWHQAYLRDGCFDQYRMLALVEDVLQSGPRLGFNLTRLIAHMEWALEDMPGVDDLLEYETRLNYVLPKYKDPVI